jgi:hypothetical protein
MGAAAVIVGAFSMLHLLVRSFIAQNIVTTAPKVGALRLQGPNANKRRTPHERERHPWLTDMTDRKTGLTKTYRRISRMA